MKALFFYFLILFPIFICDDVLPEPEPSKKKLNVVIFFTHTDDECNNLQEDSLKSLNLHEETRIKHSLEDNNKESGSPYCKVHLKSGLLALTRFCHAMMKMKTAIASVSSKELTNDIQKPEAIIKRHSRSSSNNNDNIITSAKHTEIFEIRVKRNAEQKDNEKKKNVEIINEVPVEKTTRKPWVTFDIMAHVRLSFFDKFFTNDKKSKQNEENLPDISKLRKEKPDSALFNIVKSTLDSLLLDSEINGFLMVIFGGHLATINDKYSPLVQSIKHIIENVDCVEDNTLIIVTGSCTNDSKDEGKVDQIPIFARGPYSNMLSECKLLYDIPLTVRRILEVHRGQIASFPNQ